MTVAVWMVMGVADGEEQPSGCGAEDGTLITPLGRMRVCARLAGGSLE